MSIVELKFNSLSKSCPACESENLKMDTFTSGEGFMSLPGVKHSLCLSCGSYFVNPQPSESSLARFYEADVENIIEDSIIESSIDRYFDTQKRKYFIKHRIEPIIKYLEPETTVLDVGCGTGVFVRYMLDFGFTAEGIDSSYKSIDIGKERLNLGSQMLTTGDWTSIPADKKYGLISAWTVIEHLSQPSRFLQFLQSHLLPQGLILLEFPTVDSLLFKYLHKDFFWVMPPYHLTLFSREGMRLLLRRCGFAILEEYNMPRNWNFTNSVSRKMGIHTPSNSKIDKLFEEIDLVFDKIAYDLNQSSSVCFICRSIN